LEEIAMKEVVSVERNEVISVERHESVDLSTLRELRELTSSTGNPERFRDLINLFLDSLQTDLQSMRFALAARNAAELSEIAHGLKGTSGSVGANCLAVLCTILERLCQNGQLSEARSLVRDIEDQALFVRRIMMREASN
jgi:HPt (histidine-containing phosphotransfer) domain-containing protein